MCPPVPVRKIALATVIIKESWRHEYKEVDSETCIDRIATDGEACKDCSSADRCDQWITEEGSESETVQCFALDLGTSGVAGQGYSDEEFWYFTDGYDIDHENRQIIFYIPMFGGLRYRQEDHYLNGYEEKEYIGEIHKVILDLTEQWKPRTNCGCI